MACPRLGWIAILLLLLSVGASVFIWWPRVWIFTNDAKALAGDEWADRTDDYVYRKLATFMAGHAERNRPTIDKLHSALVVAIVTATLSVVFWIALLAWELRHER